MISRVEWRRDARRWRAYDRWHRRGVALLLLVLAGSWWTGGGPDRNDCCDPQSWSRLETPLTPAAVPATGGEVQPVRMGAEFEAVVAFAPSHTILPPDGLTVLQPLVDALRADPRRQAVIWGLHDADEDAVAMAAERAAAVVAAFEWQGVARDRLKVRLSAAPAVDRGPSGDAVLAPRQLRVTVPR